MKPMKTMKAYLTYALNKEGDLVHIDGVPNGNECECFCPHCMSELCAKNEGVYKVHHFAHLNGADCVGAIESALHKAFEDKRLRGEWFALDEKDVLNVIKTLS